MAVNITDADSYINLNVINVDDWTEADEAKKQRIINVANRTLTKKFPDTVIPDNAVYEFSAILATVFNDVNKYAQQGVSQFSVSGVTSFQFNDANTKELDYFINRDVIDLINEANDERHQVSISKVKWTVL